MLLSATNEILASGNIKGKVFTDCSTVHPETVTAVAKKLTDAGAEFVSGRYMPTAYVKNLC